MNLITQLDFLDTPQCPVYLGGYKRIIVAFSGGKDSVACVLHLLECGADLNRIELWHHKVDGLDSTLMDWPCTNAYCLAFAHALGVPLYYTWKNGGFEGEMLRENSRTAPISFEAPQPDGSVLIITTGGTGGKESTRLAFPQIAASLSVRWCSGYLKIDNARTALRNQQRFNHSRTLFLCGERAQESPGRARYPRFQVDDSDARTSPGLRRHIDRWRPVHQWSEADVWAIMERWRINPHPSYRLGWSRCSCAGCIFNGADQFATWRLIAPDRFQRLVDYEERFGRTIKRNISLTALADKGTPFPVKDEDVRAALSETWYEPIILPEGQWKLPMGAFAENGGPI
ncbi:phosphoadenosine phosphosulfate reductase family protein [Hymenobacter sp. BT18]|uniref:phosphoadenosine phosphosulfate reductase domain-containing protein n=1 Tax=Hymenobacter sp. BT18 TaxID=2835648 RepID=UPI00143EBCE5|nr:phosphoadenosine phosphosulfate reductase family protein [Hymenobacter sp. BT18]QIX60895.1 phosphoadenosine phosphosulfate reductase family protein [Hymenobacter sp. BT18]